MTQEMKSFILILLTVIISAMFPHTQAGETLASWVSANLGSLKPTDEVLMKAEAKPKVIKVDAKGGGQFKTIKEACDTIPEANKERIVIHIAPGVYKEKIILNLTKDFVTFYGDPNNMPTIVFGGTNKQFGTLYSATVTVHSDYFMAANIKFVNSAPQPDGKSSGQQAVAMRIDGEKAAFYNCKFIGFQDTLCDDRGKHFFKDCYIEGTVDFIFGRGQTIYVNCTIHTVVKDTANGAFGVITAHFRQDVGEDDGYTFIFCKVTGVGKNTTFLGRSWMPTPKVIFAYSEISDAIKAEGWTVFPNEERKKTVDFGEFSNTGPGADMAKRVPFAKKLTEAEVKPYMNIDYLQGREWLMAPPKL